MKISFFIGVMHTGGAERQLIYVANNLAELGHNVKIVTLKNGQAYESLLSSEVQVVNLSSTSSLSGIIKTYSYFRKNKSDLIVCFLYHATLIGRILGTVLRIPVITSYRNTSYGGYWRDVIIRLTSLLDTKTLSNSKKAEERLCLKCLNKSVDVIPNYFFPDNLGCALTHKQDKSSFDWCYVGRLAPQKNLEQLLYAFKEFCNSGTANTKLYILGSGPEEDKLKKLSAKLNLEDKLVFLGHSYDVRTTFEKSDAFILPSLREGMPNALMEAMYFGLPSVVTPAGATPEMIQDGANGYVSNGFSYKHIADSMLKLYSLDDNARKSMGSLAQQYIKFNCSTSHITSLWNNVIINISKG